MKNISSLEDTSKPPSRCRMIPKGPQTFISFPLLPSLGSLGTTLAGPRRASERHHMTLPGHEGAFNGPPMALGGNPWAPVPGPRGPPDSCTIIHVFSSFRAIFRHPGARRVFSSRTSLGSPGCPRIPHGASDLHFLPTFAFPWLARHDPSWA